MTLQILGGIIICTATTLLGLHLGGAGARRTKDLLEFKKTLILLKSQINFAIYTLPQAFHHISQRAAPPFDQFYTDLANELETGQMEAQAAWTTAVDKLKQSSLSKEDLANLQMLGASLGHMDAVVQINSIDMIITGIDDSLQQLLTQNPKNAKMYRGLGIVSGLLITIVLL